MESAHSGCRPGFETHGDGHRDAAGTTADGSPDERAARRRSRQTAVWDRSAEPADGDRRERDPYCNALGDGGAPIAGIAKGGEPNIPPELLRLVNLSLLTTTPTGTHDLSPASRLALQQIMAQARANPAAFKAQSGSVANAPRGQQ